jgi:nitrite reductase/ring-hydroxylating ferredoxin subunit
MIPLLVLVLSLILLAGCQPLPITPVVPTAVAPAALFPMGEPIPHQLPIRVLDEAFPTFVYEGDRVTDIRYTEEWVFPTPVFVIRHDDQRVTVLYNRDPHSGCHLSWRVTQGRFIDPCHGSHYALDGSYAQGPSLHGLGWLSATIRDGQLIILERRVKPGAPAPTSAGRTPTHSSSHTV